MSYRKMKMTPVTANSERCLVLRQQYALRMLKVLTANKRVINVDETWMNHTNFSSKEWAIRGQYASRGQKALTPRISIIAAISADGHGWFSLH